MVRYNIEDFSEEEIPAFLEAEGRFCDELDEYLNSYMEESGMEWEDAVAQAKVDYDEFWKACLEYELDEE